MLLLANRRFAIVLLIGDLDSAAKNTHGNHLELKIISKLANQCEFAWSTFKSTKNEKNFYKMTVSKFKRGQFIRVIAAANKPEISSLKNKFST